MTIRPEDLRAAVPLLRTAEHVDAIRVLADALDQVLTDPDAPGLDQLLGLDRATAVRRRDDAIRNYRIRHLPGLSSRAAAELMSTAMRRYQTTQWRNDKTAPNDRLALITWDALSAGIPLPGSEAIRKSLGG